MMKFALLVLGFSFVLADASHLKLSLYYETLCPDSIRFVVDQLYPTYKQLGAEFDLELIAFGFASYTNDTGEWEFTCQHGEQECYGNKVQSCAAFQNPVDEALQFLNCVMVTGRNWDNSTLQSCAKDSNVQWSEVQNCLTSGRADLLLIDNGKKTAEVDPKIKFIPTVTFNDYFNQTLQDQSLINLKGVICDVLEDQPPQCSGESDDIFVNMI